MKILRDERGAALILVILMLALMAVVGVFSVQMSTTETKIANNEKLHKVSLHEADGGAEAGVELLEENIAQRGFTASGTNCYIGNVAVDTGDSTPGSLKFYMNQSFDLQFSSADGGINVVPKWNVSQFKDAIIPKNATGIPVTTLLYGGKSQMSTGSAMQMAAGYEQAGKGAGSGGSWKIFDIRSRHQDADNSESTVDLGWRHVN